MTTLYKKQQSTQSTKYEQYPQFKQHNQVKKNKKTIITDLIFIYHLIKDSFRT